MSATRKLLRAGAYLDSVVLLDLQRRLAAEPGVLRAIAAMGTEQNQEMLAVSGLRNHLQAGLTLDDLAQTLAENRMILGDQNADFSSHGPFLLRCPAREAEWSAWFPVPGSRRCCERRGACAPVP